MGWVTSSTFYDEEPQREYGPVESHMAGEWPRPNSVCFFGSEACTPNHNAKLPPIANALKDHIGPQRACFPEEKRMNLEGHPNITSWKAVDIDDEGHPRSQCRWQSCYYWLCVLPSEQLWGCFKGSFIMGVIFACCLGEYLNMW